MTPTIKPLSSRINSTGAPFLASRIGCYGEQPAHGVPHHHAQSKPRHSTVVSSDSLLTCLPYVSASMKREGRTTTPESSSRFQSQPMNEAIHCQGSTVLIARRQKMDKSMPIRLNAEIVNSLLASPSPARPPMSGHSRAVLGMKMAVAPTEELATPSSIPSLTASASDSAYYTVSSPVSDEQGMSRYAMARRKVQERRQRRWTPTHPIQSYPPIEVPASDHISNALHRSSVSFDERRKGDASWSTPFVAPVSPDHQAEQSKTTTKLLAQTPETSPCMLSALPAMALSSLYSQGSNWSAQRMVNDSPWLLTANSNKSSSTTAAVDYFQYKSLVRKNRNDLVHDVAGQHLALANCPDSPHTVAACQSSEHAKPVRPPMIRSDGTSNFVGCESPPPSPVEGPQRRRRSIRPKSRFSVDILSSGDTSEGKERRKTNVLHTLATSITPRKSNRGWWKKLGSEPFHAKGHPQSADLAKLPKRMIESTKRATVLGRNRSPPSPSSSPLGTPRSEFGPPQHAGSTSPLALSGSSGSSFRMGGLLTPLDFTSVFAQTQRDYSIPDFCGHGQPVPVLQVPRSLSPAKSYENQQQYLQQ